MILTSNIIATFHREETYSNLGKSLHVSNEIELFIKLIITCHIQPKDKDFRIDYILNTTVISFKANIKMLFNLGVFDRIQINIKY